MRKMNEWRLLLCIQTIKLDNLEKCPFLKEPDQFLFQNLITSKCQTVAMTSDIYLWLYFPRYSLGH